MFLIRIQGNEPIFIQIKNQVNKFIEIGVLKPNDKLPSVRNLAQELGVNPNTVAKAYLELEQEGIVYTLNKKGVFVSEGLSTNNHKNQLMKEFSQIAELCLEHNITKEELMKALQGMEEKEDVKD